MTIGITWRERTPKHDPPFPDGGLDDWLHKTKFFKDAGKVTRCSKCHTIPVYVDEGLCERCREVVRASKSRLVRRNAVKCKQRGCRTKIFIKPGYSGYCIKHYRLHK